MAAHIPRTYESVIGRLRTANPPAVLAESAGISDEQKALCEMLSAAHRGDVTALAAMDAALVDQMERTLATQAIKGGHVAVWDWLAGRRDARWRDWSNDSPGDGDDAVVRWAGEGGSPRRSYFVTDFLMPAAGYGHVHMLAWLARRGFNVLAEQPELLMGEAGRDGHIAVLDWLEQQGLDVVAEPPGSLGALIRNAARGGHRDVLEWVEARGIGIMGLYAWVIADKAAGGGHLALLQWMQGRGMAVTGSRQTFMAAFRGGHMAVVDWMVQANKDHADSPSVQDALARWRLWQARHGECPRGLHKVTPYLHRPRAFADVLAMLQTEGYDEASGSRYAYNTAGLFGTTDRVLAYLEKWGVPGKQPLHDAVQNIELPQDGRFNVAAWGDAVLRHGPKMARLVKFAGAMREPIKDGAGQWSYTRTREEVAKIAYEHGAENPALAGLCFSFNWSAQSFDAALAQVAKYRGLYNDGTKPGGRIPDITIDGAVFGKPGYMFSRLPDGDMRGLALGEFTNCCQHLDGAGRECASHGFISPQAGFYVVTDKEKHIVAQSWAWRGTRRELVLDSLESLGDHMGAPQWRSLCDEFARRALADGQAKISAVHIGKGGATPAMGYEEVSRVAMPRDYSGYRDSSLQYRVMAR